MAKRPEKQFAKCEHCGHDRAEHHFANLADGAFTGKYLLVCPTAVFKHRDLDVNGLPFRGVGNG